MMNRLTADTIMGIHDAALSLSNEGRRIWNALTPEQQQRYLMTEHHASRTDAIVSLVREVEALRERVALLESRS